MPQCNNPDLFPELQFDILREYVNEWVGQLKKDGLIAEQVRLSRPDLDLSQRYLLEFYIPAIDPEHQAIDHFYYRMRYASTSYENLRSWEKRLGEIYKDTPKWGFWSQDWYCELTCNWESWKHKAKDCCWILYESLPFQDVPFPCPNEAWENISFVLKSDELVSAKTPLGEARIGYDQLGFADRRTGDRPNKTTWTIFCVLARHNGEISKDNPHYCRNISDKASALNQHLQKMFGIKESIFTGHYKRERRYKTRFKISDARHT